MYSPADLPSSKRAAPAKKRMLSELTGISSFAYESGFPTFCDSSSASSSVCSSIASASFSSASARSPGVVSSHSGSAFLAASTARSTSPSEPLGTSAITSPVAGFKTSIVPPSTASTHSPPTKFLCWETVTLIANLPVSTAFSLSLPASREPGVLRKPLREPDRDQRHHDHEQRHHVHDRLRDRPEEVGEDPDRQRLLRARGEDRDDDLVPREGEREQPTGEERRPHLREGHEAEGLPRVGAEIGGRLLQRAREPPQPRLRIVVDEDDAEGRVPDDDREQPEVDPDRRVGRAQREAGDDPGQREGQDHEQRDRVATEEVKARDGERGQRPEHERQGRRPERRTHREPERLAHALVVARDREPLRRIAVNRPALRDALVERVERDQDQRQGDERERQGGAEPQERACESG